MRRLQRVAAALAPEAEAIARQVGQDGVVGSDETSALVDGATWWKWVSQTEVADTVSKRGQAGFATSLAALARPGTATPPPG
ncbi:MAG TPA: hypothetical protein VFA70_02920 [Dehalococcoidia bacterium]|jgi:hypothetical protein|nr:hypothetical protein [Dehalococcoidia bacterium]